MVRDTTRGRQGAAGFTLIEMSIVLVIIGLIIGGILKGQEIIESSRQKNVISQIDAMRSAINTFADKYNSLPGDYSLATTRIYAAATNGGGNGVIGAIAANAAALDGEVGNAGENLHFWNHLAAAELVSGTTLNGAATGFGDVNALPAVSIPGAGMTVAYGTHDTVAASTRQTHWVRIHKAAGTAIGTNAVSGAFSPKRMFEVDLKIDDGNAHNGSARIQNDTTTCSDAAGIYTALVNTQTCAGYFELVQ